MIKNLLVTVCLLTSSVQAETCPEMLKEATTVIKKCDIALTDKQAELDKLKIAFDTQQGYLSGTQRSLNDANDKLNSPLRNPFFMGAVGVVTGVVLTIIFVKK